MYSKIDWVILAKKIVYGCAVLWLSFLFVVSLIYSSDGYEQSVNIRQTCLTILCGGIVLILFLLLARCLEKLPEGLRIAGAVLLGISIVSFSAWWIVNSAYLPKSDAESVYDIAMRAKNHDLLPFAPTGSYMSLWPYQAGLVMFTEIILRAIPNADEMTIQWMYLPFVALALVSGYMLVRRLFANGQTRVLWCLLMVFCLPFYFYVNNMYGTVPALAGTLFVFWMLTEYIHRNSIAALVLAGIGMTGTVGIRKNELIFVIACILVLGTMFLARREKKLLLMAVVLILASVAGNVVPRAFYEYRAKNTMGEGIPAISFIAMGLQWEEGRGHGGWNGYHSDLFMACDYDGEEAARISAESIRDSLKYMAENPAYAVSFFYYKLSEQWTREDYSSLYSTLSHYADRSPTAWEIYQGKWLGPLMLVMAVHQSLVYFGACCFCVSAIIRWKKQKNSSDIWRLIPLVTFIGGFLFSIIWEAGSRYVLPYVILLIPYAAEGFAELGAAARKLWKTAVKEA